MEVLLKGIYAKKAGSTLNTAIGGRLYVGSAPQKITFPYVVYDIITNTTMGVLQDTTGEEITLQFSIFSNKKTVAEINTLFENLKTVYDECSLTITGYTHMRMFRNFSSLIRDVENNIWAYHIEYTIWMWKN